MLLRRARLRRQVLTSVALLAGIAVAADAEVIVAVVVAVVPVVAMSAVPNSHKR